MKPSPLRTILSSLALGAFALLGAGCNSAASAELVQGVQNGPVNGPVAWSEIRSWMRQDNGFPDCSLSEIAKSRFDMVTVSSRCDGKLWTEGEIEKVRSAGKWTLVYLDVSRVATYETRLWGKSVTERSPFITGRPASWGAYSVMVDHPGWWAALKTLIDDEISRGYDGFFLDDCAGYWEEKGYFDPIANRWVAGGATPENRAKAAALVRRIRDYVDRVRPGMRLICNGDANLVEDDLTARTGYLEALDGVVYEGRVYHAPDAGSFGVETSPGRRAYSDKWYARMPRGKGVFVLDYTGQPAEQRRTWSEARKLGFVPAVNVGNRLPYFEADAPPITDARAAAPSAR